MKSSHPIIFVHVLIKLNHCGSSIQQEGRRAKGHFILCILSVSHPAICISAPHNYELPRSNAHGFPLRKAKTQWKCIIGVLEERLNSQLFAQIPLFPFFARRLADLTDSRPVLRFSSRARDPAVLS